MQARGLSNENDIKISSDGTFNFTRYLEKELLFKIAKTLRLPFSSFSGYITSGGTEANMYSMWVAREWARTRIKDKKEGRIYWIIPENVHYSIRKALQLLDVANNSENKIVKIETDSLGRADYKQIEESIVRIRKESDEPIILPLTAMTTECGSIDLILNVNEFISKSNINNVFFHIDAAFSGLFLPFVSGYEDIFSLKSLSSISVDFSKTFCGPVGSGAVIFKSGLENYAKINAPYLADGFDCTLTGSRRGLDVIAMYALLSTRGQADIQKEACDAIEKTTFLANEMLKIEFLQFLYDPKLNYIVFSIKNAGSKDKKIREIFKSYSISPSIVRIDGRDVELFKIIIRSDHKYKNIRKLIRDLKLLHGQK